MRKIQLLSAITTFILFINQSYAAGAHDHSAHSDNDSYAHLDFKIHFDSITKADEADEEINETYSHSHFEWGINLNDNFSIHSNLKLEGESSGHSHGHAEEEAEHSSGDRFLEEHPLFVSKLIINYKNEDFSAYAGKFNPIVGFDYHQFPGVFGYQTIEGYAIRERLGVGAIFKNDLGDYGKHQLNVSSFFADTTALSNSILHRRGATKRADGGVSNTEKLSSFAVSLGGKDFYSLNNNIAEGLSYQVGYAKQAAGDNNEKDESRHSLSLGYQQKISQDLSTEFVFEHMDIKYLSGEAEHNRIYDTLSAQLNYQKWNWVISRTAINNQAAEADENHDGSVTQLSAGYSFDNGIDIDIAKQRSDQDNEITERVGIALSYSLEF
ncbi:MAG: hypothetical protein PSN36_07015 [Gammaproteobacteria bacterium]|nr:hypothetical protein [Gammaproteobacteria bacterium]